METFQFYIPLFLGIFFGFITGFTPGLHVNNIVSLLLLNYNFLSETFNFNNYDFSIFIISLAITHSITEIFPTALLGVPDNNTFISLLPIQKIFLEGKIYNVILLSLYSSFIGGITILFLAYYSKKIILVLNILLGNTTIILILIFIQIFLILYNFNFKSLILIFSTMTLGILSLKQNFIMPLLSGLFGLPMLFESLKNKNTFVKQNYNFEIKTFFNKKIFLTITYSIIIGIIFSYLPGTGTSIASFFILLLFPKVVSEEKIIVSNSSISTVNFMFSLYTFYYNNTTRNGAILGVKTILHYINKEFFTILLLYSSITLFLTTIISIIITKKIIKLLSKLSLKQYKKITYSIIILNFIIAFFSNKILGVIFLILSSIIGYFALKNKIEKTKMLSSLITPTILLKLQSYYKL